MYNNRNSRNFGNSDNRMVCRYGNRCYQKNPDHLRKFKHPNVQTPNKNVSCSLTYNLYSGERFLKKNVYI